MKKIILILLFLFIPLLSFAEDTYPTIEQVNGAISAFSGLYGTDISDFPFDVPERNMFLIHYGVPGSGKDDRVEIVFFNSPNGVEMSDTSCTGFSSGMKWYFDESSLTWKRQTGTFTYVNCNFPLLLISSNTVVTSNESNVFYIYDLLNGAVVKRVNQIETDLETLETKVNTIETRVDDLVLENASISEKMDVLIDNTGQIVDNTDKLYDEPTVDSNNFADAFPQIEIDDQTASTFDATVENVFSAITSSGSQTIDFTVNGHTYTVNSDDLDISSSGLAPFLTALSSFGVSLFLAKDLRKEINKIKEGKFEKVASEDISADIV